MVNFVLNQEKNTVGFKCVFDYDEAEVLFYIINADLKTKLFPPILMIMRAKSSSELLKVKFLNRNRNNMEEVC